MRSNAPPIGNCRFEPKLSLPLEVEREEEGGGQPLPFDFVAVDGSGWEAK